MNKQKHLFSEFARLVVVILCREGIQELDRKITVLFPLVNEAIELAERPKVKAPEHEAKEEKGGEVKKQEVKKKTESAQPAASQKFTGQVRVKKPSVWAAKMRRRAG